MASLVRTEKLHKRFLHEGKDLHVLRDVHFEMDEGEMLCIVGASGAGKSTLLHVLGTLELPTSGSIFFEETEITGLSSRKLAEFRNHSIGFVFQFHHLLPEFTAIENILMPAMIRGQKGRKATEKEIQDYAEFLLEEVGLQDRRAHRPAELSGGEQQRVALARALIMKPKLVLADEPTGNLDSVTSKAIRDLLFRLNDTLGTAFLIVTHSQELAAQMPRVVVMRDGTIESDDRRVSNHPLVAEAGS